VRALVTGAAGQDGTILCTMLARQNAGVVAAVKPGTDTSLLRCYAPEVTVAEVDLGDADALGSLVRDVQPDEVYNLGGFTAPGDSWDHQDEVRRINVDAVAVLLEAVSAVPGARMFQASSASIFEGADRSPQTERSERLPKSPYAVSKAEAMALVDAARGRGVHAVSAILYNHESPLRGEGFVTRRVTMGVARIAAGLQDVLELGDVETARDWGWAPDYVRGMQLMLRADVPHDYVLATGISHRLSFFIGKAFAAAGIEDWQPFVRSTTDRTRPVDTNILVGDARAAYLELGWRHTVDFDSMAGIMVRHDMALLEDPDALWPIP
jgi:GDPmannose 4,6-dehydratase